MPLTPPVRCLYFVPGNQPDRLRAVPDHRPDASKVADLDGLRRHARSYRSLGYTGYVAVHPDQIEPVQEVFTPDAEEIDYAHRLLEAMADAEQRGSGLVELDGELQARCAIDYARRVLRHAGGAEGAAA